MLIDSHCHLDYLARKGVDIAEVIARADAVGVKAFLSVATTLACEEILADFCATFPQVFRSVGVHPNHAHEEPNLTAEQLVVLSRKPKVIALGETGLDNFRQDTDAETQKNVFRAHLRAAQETHLPLIIHTRSADEDTVRVMLDAYTQKPFRGVFHCYTGSQVILEAAGEMDFYISITGMLTYGKSQELRDRVGDIPPDRLMVETDAPFLAPKPHRGQPCEPYMVAHTAELLAEILQQDMRSLGTQTSKNFARLFDRYVLADATE